MLLQDRSGTRLRQVLRGLSDAREPNTNHERRCEMSYLELYLLTRLDALSITLVSIAIASLFGVIISLFLYSEAYDKGGEKMALSWVRKFAISLCVSTLLAVAIPTQEDAIVIYG